jgi:hypothetical protein
MSVGEEGARGPHARTHCQTVDIFFILFILFLFYSFYLFDFILNYFNCILNN